MRFEIGPSLFSGIYQCGVWRCKCVRVVVAVAAIAGAIVEAEGGRCG